MESFIASFKDSFETWGYVALFFYCMGSGYVGILAAGALATLGHISLATSIIIATAGNFAGSSLLVILTRYQKKDFERFLAPHRRKIALMYIWLKKYGAILILLNKYIYGAKFLVPVAIGASRYNLKKFLVLNLLASVIWAASLGLLAFYFSKAVIELVESYGQYSYVVVGVLLALVLGALWFSKKAWAKKSWAKTKDSLESS